MSHRVLYNPHLHTSRTFTSLVQPLDADPRLLPTFSLSPPQPSPLPLFRPAPGEVAEVRRMGLGFGPPRAAASFS